MSLPLPPEGAQAPVETDPSALPPEVAVDPLTGGVDGPEGEGAAAETPDEETPEEEVPEDAPSGADEMRELVVQAARSQIGVPSVAGGGSPDGASAGPDGDDDNDPIGFDNGGLVQFALAQGGIDAPRLTEEQVDLGDRVEIPELAPGDLVAYGDGDHVAIWTERNTVIDALDGEQVDEHELDESKQPWGVSLEMLYTRGI